MTRTGSSMLLFVFIVLLLISACSSSGRHKMNEAEREKIDLSSLQNKISNVTEDDFGEMAIEIHHAGEKLDYAQNIYDQVALNRLPKKVKDAGQYVKEGEQAAEQALLHRENAEDAFQRIITVLEETSLANDNSERLAYLESLHVEQGVEIPVLPVYFDFSSSQLTPAEEKKMEKLIGLLDDYPLFSLRLIAYADTVGSKSRNFRLAEARNYTVLRTLHKYGLPVNTVVTVTVGEADGPDETRNPQNRRVEIVPYVHGAIPKAENDEMEESENAEEVVTGSGDSPAAHIETL